MSISKKLSRILDENRSKILTVGNINDLGNVFVQFGIKDPGDDIVNYIDSFPEGSRILVVYSDEEPTDASKVFPIESGYLAVKELS